MARPATRLVFVGFSSLSLLAAHLPAHADSHTVVVESHRLSSIAPESYRARTSTIASKRPMSFLDEARTVETITPQLLQDSNATTLTDAMTFSAGVTQGNTMGGTEDGFIKRGFGSNSDGSILIDGIRQPRGTFSMATVDHVEVLKGPGALFHGQQDPGGVINLVTKRPEYTWQRSISGDLSSFGGGNASIDVTGPIQDTGLAFRFIVDHRDENDWRSFGTRRRTTVAPSLRWEGEHNRAQLSYEYRDYDLTLDRGTVITKGTPAGVPRKRRFDESWSRVYGHDQAITGWWEQDLVDDWKMRLTYGWNRRQYSDGQPRVLGVDDTTGALTRRADANKGFDRRVIYTSLDVTGDLWLANQRHEIVLGADHERQRDYLADVYRGSAVTDSTVYNAGNRTLTLDTDDYNAGRSHRLDEINTTGVYVNDRWHLDDQWILALGGRFSHYEQYGGRGRPFVVSTDTQDDIFLPSASLLYRLSDRTSAYASYSEAFVPNGADSDTGQLLEPEHSRGYEIGLKHLWTDQLAGTVAVYRIRKDNVAVSDNGVTRTVGQASAQGIELGLNGEFLPRWSVLANYAYTDTEVIRDTEGNKGNRLPNAARHTATVYMAHDLALAPHLGQWRVGGGVRYVGAREGDSDNSFSLDDYTVADAFIGWDSRLWGQSTHLQLNVKNLFDSTYYPSSGGSTRVVVGDPLEITLTGRVSL
ncbi:TonB-dependent siderophore receptor [Larsenimonas rhizosphaerae]|uniref:TonB-dependent siderophore receptor n=1 Tax=Larsenimonas rhizosphaerae TaxID=2944682 RepID=A0AA41ZJY3_9GAMM|nr:TonB-dependent siderophore receptor [Larsenimonas rhizosphaerae]MCX2522973.1 TonB-dependent siderophore receptor [Larsenimonas rhizosphaerae]